MKRGVCVGELAKNSAHLLRRLVEGEMKREGGRKLKDDAN